MAGGSRTLKLTILGDVDNLSKSLKTAETDTTTFGTKVTDTGKVIGAAFAAAAVAAGALAVKIGVDSVNAAIADEKAQTQLATAITAATGATNANITAVESQILKLSLATGVADDQLRPALGRLVLSTNDTQAATALLNTALDISAATGKPLETVTNALAKAYDGNTTSLAKLGVGYGAAELKGKDFNTVVGELNTQFGGAAATAAETYQGKIDRVKVALDEAKESLGVALLPIVEKFSEYLLTSVIPNVTSFINGLTGQGSLTEASATATTGAFEFGEQVKKTITTIIGLKKEIIIVGALIAALFITSKISAAVSGTIALIKGVIAVYNALKVSAIVAGVAQAFALNPLLGVAAVALGAAVLAGANALANKDDGGGNVVGAGGFSGTTPGGQSFAGTLKTPVVPKITTGGGGGGTGGGGGGLSSVSQTAAVAAVAASNIVTGSFGAGSFRAGEAASMGTTVNLTVNGAIDSEGTARTIVETLNDSYYRGTGGGGNLEIA